MPDLIEEISSHWEKLRDGRTEWENHWQEVADHTLGRRDFNTKRQPGTQRQIKIYDTTARDATNLLAAALHSLLTNPATDWFDLRFQRSQLNEVDEAVLWLDEVEQEMLNSFRRPESAFNTNMHEVYTDLVAFGTSGIFVEDEPGFGARFSSRPLSELFIDEDHSGRITVVYRKFKLLAWQAVKQFGKEAVPRSAKDVEANHVNNEHEFLHLVRRNPQPLPGRIDAKGMPWASIYISLDDKKVVSEGGYFENPYMVSRWNKDSGELYGRGPGIDSLADAKMLNAIWRTYIRNAEKAADPPLLVEDDGVMPGSQLRITPSARITVRPTGSRLDPVRYLEHRGRFDISDLVIETKTQLIRKAYHSEIIQAFQDPRMTATQVIELARLSQRILSPVLGRMQTELLEPMIERVYGILSRSPNFPQAPDFLQGQEIKIEYVSPVARAQKASESQAILDSFQAIAAMATVDPGVVDNVNMDSAARAIFEGNGVPAKIMRPKAEVIEIRRAQAEAQAQQQQLAEGLAVAEGASKLIPALDGVGGNQ